MAKWIVGKGLDEYLAKLGNLQTKSPEAIGKAIYKGAEIVADQVRANIQALPVEGNGHRKGRRNPTQVEKDGLLAGLGIARKQERNGYVNVKIGMDGYNSDVTEKYPNGKPNAMIARSIESGTSFVNRIPFIASAVRSSKAAAEEAIKNELEKQLEDIMK